MVLAGERFLAHHTSGGVVAVCGASILRAPPRAPRHLSQPSRRPCIGAPFLSSTHLKTNVHGIQGRADASNPPGYSSLA
jgi:hypothetical protein